MAGQHQHVCRKSIICRKTVRLYIQNYIPDNVILVFHVYYKIILNMYCVSFLLGFSIYLNWDVQYIRIYMYIRWYIVCVGGIQSRVRAHHFLQFNASKVPASLPIRIKWSSLKRNPTFFLSCRGSARMRSFVWFLSIGSLYCWNMSSKIFIR